MQLRKWHQGRFWCQNNSSVQIAASRDTAEEVFDANDRGAAVTKNEKGSMKDPTDLRKFVKEETISSTNGSLHGWEAHCTLGQKQDIWSYLESTLSRNLLELRVIQLVQPGQIQIQGGQAVQVQGQQGQTQQIIIQQPQTAVTAGQTQTQPQIAVQGQQVAQTAEGQTIVYQPVNADGTILQQGCSETGE
ncbi:UNVERIFIED_CONTAM: hypothetical protein K2H54_057553 [Gekko kuhli]